jgi:NAD(P)H-flavin reductase
LGPSGNFIFRPTSKTALFLATGVGVAPFKSIIEHELKNGNTQNFHLIFTVRYFQDIFYQDFFEKLAKKYHNFTFTFSLTRPENSGWKGTSGRITALLKNISIDLKNTKVYICGLKEMVDDCTNFLLEKGLHEADIHFEKYD